MTYPAYKLGLFLLCILQSFYVTEHDMVPLPGMNTISRCGFIQHQSTLIGFRGQSVRLEKHF